MDFQKKPEVLFVAGSGEYGSGECQFLDYLGFPEEKPFSATLIFPSPGRLADKAKNAGLSCRIIKSLDYLTEFRNLWKQPIAWVYNLSSFVKISSVIREKRAALVVSLSFVNWTGALSARQEGIRHLWVIREVLSSRSNWLNFFWGRWLASRLANDLSVKILLESSLAAEMFRRKRTREIVEVLPPAVDPAKLYGQLVEPNSGLQRTALALVFSGPDLKRVREALKMVNGVLEGNGENSARVRRVFLVFPGLSSEKQENLQKRVSREVSGLKFPLEFAAWDWLSANWKNFLTVVIFPGFDPLSRIVLEAGLAEVPVVVEKGASSELILPGNTGFVFEPGDYAALADSMKMLIRNPEKVRETGCSAREHILNNYTLSRWKEKFERVISGILFSSES